MENENSKSESINPEENSHQDEVPAWLQGIDQPDMEDTSPNEPVKNDDDAWVKENLQVDSETNQSETDAEEIQTSKKPLPDWLSQLSNIDDETQKKIDASKESNIDPLENIDLPDASSDLPETTDELEIDADIQNSGNDIQDVDTKDTEENEGFIEISELDLAESLEPSPSSEDTDISVDEDLPPWLDEMIAEPTENIEDHPQNETEPDEKQGEPTEPFNVSLDAPPFEEISMESFEEFNRGLQEMPNEITEEDNFSIIEGDTEPVTLPSFSTETSDFNQDEKEIFQDQPDELPKTLMFAKHLLDQSEFEPAKKILDTYIEQSKYTEEISQWLGEIVNQPSEAHSDVWELLGDIALQNNDPDEALAAYSKAMSLLLSERKNNHEAN